MAQKFLVQVLNDKEFNSLPYKNISDSIGIADKEKGMAFVRRTGLGKEFDMMTLAHEVNHLISSNKTDADEYGIMHKKGGVLKDIMPAIVGAVLAPFTGGASLIPILGGALTGAGMNAYAASRHPEQLGSPGMAALTGGLTGGLSGMGAGALTTGAIKGATAAGGNAATSGILGRAAGAVKGALGMAVPAAATKATGAIQGPVTAAQNAMGYQYLSQVPSNILGSAAAETAAKTMGALQGPVTAAQAAQGYTNLSQVPQVANILGVSGAIPPVAGGPSATPATTPAITPPPQAPQPTIMQTLGKKAGEFISKPENLLGAGALATSMAPKTPQFQMPSAITDLQNKLMSGQALSPLGQQAQMELGNILKSTPQELYPTANDEYYNAALRRTRESYAEAAKQLDAAYNQAGVMGSGEHLQAKADLAEELARTESGLYAETEQRRFELARNAKYQAVQQALGVDQYVMDDLLGLTGYSAEMAAQMYNANVKDVEELRKSLGTFGSELLLRGTTGKGMQSQGGTTINIK